MITVEEHSVFGGLGSHGGRAVDAEGISKPFKIVGIPDEYTVTGSQQEIFAHYGITPEGLAETARQLLAKESVCTSENDPGYRPKHVSNEGASVLGDRRVVGQNGRPARTDLSATGMGRARRGEKYTAICLRQCPACLARNEATLSNIVCS